MDWLIDGRLILSLFVELENLDKRLLNIRRVVQGLPQANFDLLRRVSEHLDKYVVALLVNFESD